MKILEDIFLFKNLSDEEKKQIISGFAEPEIFKKGEKIYSTENFSRALCVIAKGTATAKSGAVVRREFCAGDIFGAAALFGESDTYATDIYASSDCSAYFIGEEKLKEIFARYPVCAENYIAFLSEKIRFLNKKIELFSAASAMQKLYIYICENSGKKLNLSAVSRAAGIGRTSIYRALAELEKNGMVIKENGIYKVI